MSGRDLFILEIQWLILVCFAFKPNKFLLINKWLHTHTEGGDFIRGGMR